MIFYDKHDTPNGGVNLRQYPRGVPCL